LNLEVDCVDKRNFAEGQLRTRVEAFIEMLESRPRPAP
jgi:benzoyl-CoA reductase/2-hydroxyglutaryl-CoA dehydratase subunit BcrC/BadD/HgdB